MNLENIMLSEISYPRKDKSGVVVHAYNSGYWKVEAGGSRVQGQPGQS
jgi:hypothetical protein